MTTAAKLAEAERSVTAISRRLLEAVPCAEPWGTDRILTEYSRLNGGLVMDRNKGAWCLSQLIEAGLVRSPFQHHFQRVAARPILTAVKPEEPAVPAAKPTASPTPLQQLEAIARGLRDQAADLIQQAERIEDIAVLVDEQGSAEGSAQRQLEQLRAVLGGLGLGAPGR